ncbi:conserved hypothetical protein [Lodderomyces elongisporus NRRL YB-4239]|uniref:Uncharacterized protein n=1 Tax=Lodderomyces elongisporus (strain ATCC 11503 / CBS 2605 / JCM 1781 / NBRC 1676 / NRRL YB-4239) TaxID=379508 RepID=A5DWG5_LODEL|nr:conserved hypothetical protein [Lodderomyces elongisporus NRRL YB-4239]
MTYDLNIPWPVDNYNAKPTEAQQTNLVNTIVTNYALGVTHQAINFTVNESVKIPTGSLDLINPIPVKSLLSRLRPVCPDLKLYSRITLVVSDTSKLQGLSKLQSCFDLIAMQPLNEKALQMTVMNVECDLISFNLSSKLPFFLKFKTIGSGIQKGIRYEINYSHIVSGTKGYVNDNVNSNLLKKNWFSNVLQLIRSSRSKALVVSSGAQNPLQVRNGNDILVLLKTLGLDSSRAKSCITMESENALVNGRLRIKSHKQAISIGDEKLVNNDHEDSEKRNNALGYKRKISETPIGKILKKSKYV